MDEGFRVDADLLCGQSLSNYVQSLSNLSEVGCTLQMLPLHFIRRLLDRDYSIFHLSKLLIASYLFL